MLTWTRTWITKASPWSTNKRDLRGAVQINELIDSGSKTNNKQIM